MDTELNTEALHGKPQSFCDIRIGTSGYSYGEWVAAGFYPAGTTSDRMLPLYARIFPITELNYTWYQMPKAQSMERMRQHVAADFRFTAKLTRSLTHEVDPDQWRRQILQYRDGVTPLIQAGQLKAVLLQLPPYFDRSVKNRQYLAELLGELNGLSVAVEFRHASWATDKVFSDLERRKVALVAVDEPDLPGLFPRLDIVTNPDLFYIRFHGRNVKGWRSGNMQKQFDYDYTDGELCEWVEDRIEKMSRQARSGVIFFNNHVRAQAPGNAKKLMALLADRGLLISQ